MSSDHPTGSTPDKAALAEILAAKARLREAYERAGVTPEGTALAPSGPVSHPSPSRPDLTPAGIAARKAAPPSMGSNLAALGVIAVVVLLFYGCAKLVSGDDSADVEDEDSGVSASDDFSSESYRACENYIKALLKAPSTADFSGFFGSTISSTGVNYKVIGTVDAENGFGAPIRSNWTCTVRINLADETTNVLSVTGIN